MEIRINGEFAVLPEDVGTLEQFASWRELPSGGVAIALNNRIAPRSKWGSLKINEGDDLMVISAAYGG